MTAINKSGSGSNQSATDQAKNAASKAADEVKARVKDTADTVVTEAADYADQAKGAAADEVKGVASALRTAAEEMRSGSPQERTFSQIADGLADASDAVRDKDLGEMVGAVTDFARRNPMVFLGSAALIGFAATRFAKASGDGANRSNNHGQRRDVFDRSSPTDRNAMPGSADLHSPTVKTTSQGGKV